MAEHKKIDNHTLGIAAISLSKCLVSARIPFALMGGYELVLLGSNRTSKDLDVEIDASRVTFDQVIAAFEADPEFRFIPGNRRDAVSFEEKKPSFHSLQPYGYYIDPCHLDVTSRYRRLSSSRPIPIPITQHSNHEPSYLCLPLRTILPTDITPHRKDQMYIGTS